MLIHSFTVSKQANVNVFPTPLILRNLSMTISPISSSDFPLTFSNKSYSPDIIWTSDILFNFAIRFASSLWDISAFGRNDTNMNTSVGSPIFLKSIDIKTIYKYLFMRAILLEFILSFRINFLYCFD